MSTIKTYEPQIKVTLIKVVRRQGPRGLAPEIKEIDLTPWLGDQGGVLVSRQINASRSVCEATFADRLNRYNNDTLYSLVEPMDVLIIRMAREPHRYAGGELPAVFRGFVDKVRRTEHISDNKVARAVVVNGSCIGGKALQLVQIFHAQQYLVNNKLLTAYPLFELGVKFDVFSAAKFVEEVVRIANDWLGTLSIKRGLDVPLQINVDARVKMGKIGPFGIQPYQGVLWRFIENWADLAWNELIWEDRKDGPYLVYRPKPYIGLDGKLTSKDPGAAPPDEVEMDAAQVRSMDVSRGDQNVANFYNVLAPQSELPYTELLHPFYLMNGHMFLSEERYPNSAISLYGLKKLEEPSGQLADAIRQHPDRLPAGEKRRDAGDMGTWIALRRDELIAQCADNVVFEEGSLTVQGRENLRPGINLVLNRGSLRARYYVTAVTHEFKPFQGYECDLQVTRGTGFIERQKLAGSPYLAEGREGAYGR